MMNAILFIIYIYFLSEQQLLRVSNLIFPFIFIYYINLIHVSGVGGMICWSPSIDSCQTFFESQHTVLLQTYIYQL